jgi:hypothetical protein
MHKHSRSIWKYGINIHRRYNCKSVWATDYYKYFHQYDSRLNNVKDMLFRSPSLQCSASLPGLNVISRIHNLDKMLLQLSEIQYRNWLLIFIDTSCLTSGSHGVGTKRTERTQLCTYFNWSLVCILFSPRAETTCNTHTSGFLHCRRSHYSNRALKCSEFILVDFEHDNVMEKMML